jgi:hypothetical protein
LREVKAPTLLRQTINRWWQGCQPYAPAALYPQASLFLKIPVRVNDLIIRGSVQGRTPYRDHRLLICYVVIFDITSMTCFDLVRSSPGRSFRIITALLSGISTNKRNKF